MLRAFPPLLVEHLGGEEAVNILHDHHAEGMTYDALEAKYDLSRGALQRRIVTARVRLRRLGLLPPGWERNAARGNVGQAEAHKGCPYAVTGPS